MRTFTRSALVAAASVAAFTGSANAELIIGLTTSNALVQFDSATPGTASAPVAVTGLSLNEFIWDIDVRSFDHKLYGLSNLGRLYTIHPNTGVATFDTALTGATLDAAATRVAIDFNPAANRLRIVANTGQNLRLTQGTGVTTPDFAINIDPGDTAHGSTSVAYTNPDTDPGTGTRLYYIGINSPRQLFDTSQPNDGNINLLGSTGISAPDNVGFDISPSNTAYLSLSGFTAPFSRLYSINLADGSVVSNLGLIGTGLEIRGIAAVIPEPSLLGLLATPALALLRRRRS
jgi:hypothetical protein